MASNVPGESFIRQQWTQKSTHKHKQVVTVTAGKAGVGTSTLLNNFPELEGDAAFEARSGPNSVTRMVEYCDVENQVEHNEDESATSGDNNIENQVEHIEHESATSGDNNIENQVEFIHQWTKSSDKDKQVVILTAGKSGVGKSTLLNNFLELDGDAAFKARSGPDSVTTGVGHCDRVINGVQVRVIDMPGLHAVDSGDRIDKKEDIIRDLKHVTGKGADVVFYCFNLNYRLEKVDLENLDTLTQAFGPEIWKHVIFVFTNTDVVLFNESSPEELLEKYIVALHNHLVDKRKVNVEIRSIYSFSADMCSNDAEINTFNGIVGIPVSKNPATPPNWRITLLLQVIKKCQKENIPALIELNHINWREVAKTTGIAVAGGAGGAVLGAGIGALVGAVLTAPIGGVGAITAALGGAAIGAFKGTISGSVPLGLSSVTARIAYVIYSRLKIERRAYRKTKEMVENEHRLAHEANGTSEAETQL